jgi:predicted  nucleic acid-binding Zn-ribbon protein
LIRHTSETIINGPVDVPVQLMQWAAEAKGSQLTDAEDEIEEIEAELEKEKGRHQKVRQAVTDHQALADLCGATR